jgi:hypothetical protein
VSGYKQIKVNSKLEVILRPFVLSSIFVFLESFTNPFLTNSIGMNIIMVTIVSIIVLRKQLAFNGL